MRNVDPVDWWTLTHVLAGMLARRVGLSRSQLFALAVLYELVEASKPQESMANRVVDVAANVVGWELG